MYQERNSAYPQYISGIFIVDTDNIKVLLPSGSGLTGTVYANVIASINFNSLSVSYVKTRISVSPSTSTLLG